MRAFVLPLGLAAFASGANVPSSVRQPNRIDVDVDREGSTWMAQERLNGVQTHRVRTNFTIQAKTRFTTDHFIGELDVLDAQTPASGVRHPFWHFEGFQLARFQVYVCCVFLFLAGVLCSAAGIGGGGIYVTVLMVAGAMRVADAVPLSKAVVFFGSISSLILNLRKIAEGGSKTLIDYNICRLVVPSALLGTFLGVFFNRHLPSWLILSVLVAVLVFISWQTTQKTWEQYKEEEASSAKGKAANVKAQPPAPAPTPAPAAPQDRPSGEENADTESAPGTESSDKGASADRSLLGTLALKPKPSDRSVLGTGDIVLSLFMLVTVIVFGMLRFHAGECMRAAPQLQEEACNHPAHFWLGHGTMQRWMSNPSGAAFVRGFSFFFPLCVCAGVLAYFTQRLVKKEGWRLIETTQYSVMAIFTGCLAGLVGIGGGLIFAPFFLIMGVDPSIAVASSSTCVIFTSSSTCMQYLLTDRIIISLTVVYGTINLLASYVGTSLVHMLQDKFSARKSYISLIVLIGVVISTVLSVIKLVTKLVDMHHPAPATPAHL